MNKKILASDTFVVVMVWLLGGGDICLAFKSKSQGAPIGLEVTRALKDHLGSSSPVAEITGIYTEPCLLLQAAGD